MIENGIMRIKTKAFKHYGCRRIKEDRGRGTRLSVSLSGLWCLWDGEMSPAGIIESGIDELGYVTIRVV